MLQGSTAGSTGTRASGFQGRKLKMTNHPNRSVKQRKRDFIGSLLQMTPDQLAHQYQVTGEVMIEEESHEQAAAGRKMLDAIEAVGRFLHGVDFDDAMNRAAL